MIYFNKICLRCQFVKNYAQYNLKISMIHQHFGNLVAALCLLSVGYGLEWQGYGNWTSDNMTVIFNTINSYFPTYTPGTSLLPFATNISDTLNNKWDIAWNVFIVPQKDPTKDAVLVGYAFRNHWMWYNGYSYGNSTYSFIIWKDYNCKVWNNYNSNDFLVPKQATDPFYPMWSVFVNSYNTASSDGSWDDYFKDDIWRAANAISQLMNKDNLNQAYTIVITSTPGPRTDQVDAFEGRFCSMGGVESFVGGRLTDANPIYNRVALIRTR